MSYPHLIQPLIIEDDPGAHFLYDLCFSPLINERVVAPAHYAYCYEDAIRELDSNTIFHLVILDLRLPECPGIPPQDGVDFGLGILEQCVKRDRYPIPALLVISGHIGQAKQRELEARVRNGFWHGRVLVKGSDMEEELRAAVKDVQSYCSIGIHIRDSGDKVFPTLSPREDDLLRRCALNQEGCTGLDLDWWSAEFQRPTGQLAHCMGWTKTLIGQFLLDGGDKASRPNFFKLAPAGGAEAVLSSAKRMQHKLSHIKVRSDIIADTRCLLVTEKVGSGHDRPISLSTYLTQKIDGATERLSKVVQDVASQVAALGDSTPRTATVSSLLWAWHDKARLEEQWQAYGGASLLDEFGLEADPLKMYDAVSTNTNLVRYEQQTFLHGDLNITNIALDQTIGGVTAYIFDAEGCGPGVNVRDLAMLEVTALLHQPTSIKDSLVRQCTSLYDDTISVPDSYEDCGSSELGRNTFKLIAEIRAQALTRAKLNIYVLMVFDSAMLQLGGLAYTVSRNKIINPRDAVLLASLTSRWLLKVAGDLVHDCRTDIGASAMTGAPYREATVK